MEMARRNCTKDRKRNKFVAKGNLQELTTFVLELFFPTQWDLWQSRDVLWPSPAHSGTLPATPHSSPCIQTKPSFAGHLIGFSSTLRWIIFGHGIPFLKKPCSLDFMLTSFGSPFWCLTLKGPASSLYLNSPLWSLSLSSLFFLTLIFSWC